MIIGGDKSRIAEVINSLALDVRNLLKTVLEISYFSRGAWPYETVLMMSPLERDLATDLINKRLDVASKSSFPIY